AGRRASWAMLGLRAGLLLATAIPGRLLGVPIAGFEPRVADQLRSQRTAESSRNCPQWRSRQPCATSAYGSRDYSITSSARAIREGGTVRPSSFAVLRLIVSRSLVACSTGSSLGLAPRSILSIYSAPRAKLQGLSWP